MGAKYLIDTNVIIEYLAKSLPASSHQKISEIIDTSFLISVINRIEILGYQEVSENETLFMDFATVLPLTKEVADMVIEIRKKKKIKLPDAIIAATAILNDCTLLTHNSKDFTSIENLNCVDSHTF